MNIPNTEYAPFYANYVALASKYNSNNALLDSLNEGLQLFKSISSEKEMYRYEPNKWTPKDVILHIVDAEHIFQYRALRIARGDKTALPGFEENSYVETANANSRTLNSIIEEFKLVRTATIQLFETFNEHQLLEIGTASDKTISVRALLPIIIGHQLHHQNILNERYL